MNRVVVALVFVISFLVLGGSQASAFTTDACYDCTSGTCIFKPGGGCDAINASSVMQQDTTTTYSGQTFTVSWNANSVTSCTEYYNGSDGSSGTIGNSVQGSTSFAPTPVATTNYTATIDCSGPYGSTSSSVTHTVTAACPADTPYTETNPTSIATYCSGQGITCGAGYQYVSSLTCHTGGVGTWRPYNNACITQNCGGCGCVASPINGACGSANGVTYAYTATGYSPYSQCSSGSPSTTAFPSAGSSVSWTCSGSNGGSASPSCSASRSGPSSCTATTISGCSLSATASGGTSGSCSSGYTGACNFTCTNGAWSQNSNSCAASCTYSGTLTWGSCSAPVNTTVTSGNSTTVTNTAAGYTGSTTYSCSNGAWTQTSSTCNVDCALPWGGTIASGSSVTAYQYSTVTSPTTCASVAQSRTCSNGTLSGSYTNQSCTVQSSSCSATTISGCSLSATASGGTSGSCSSGYTGACNFTCTNGAWSQNSNSCAASCALPWGGTIASGSSVTAYQTSTVTSPSACSSVAQSRTCSNGTLSGTFTNPSCSVNCAATTISNCSLPVTASGASAGSCSAGYTGSCNFSCSSGTWTQTSNSCVVSTTAPSVSTSAVTSITQTTASSGGTINSNGGSAITVSGIVWGTSVNPTTALATKTTDGWAVGGPWTDGITGLTAGTVYHVRAYATNSVGTSYGSDVQFTTASLSSCSATTISNCSLPATASGGSAGSCAAGYSGACNFTCGNGTWTQNSNSCTPSAPTALLTASPNPVAYNGQSTLTWSSTYATSCTAGGPWSNSGTLNGSGLTNPLTSATTFTFQCTGPGGTSPLQSVTVNVNAPSSCSATTISNCSLPATASGGSAGSCSAGYTGACNFTCTNGTWSQTSNSCTVAATAPTVSTSAVTSITQTTASSGGTINSNGGSAITVSGIVWGTSVNPTTALATKTTDGWAVGGPWTDGITGLTAGTVYHVRAYATNSVGTSYGSDVQFTTASGTCPAPVLGTSGSYTIPAGVTSVKVWVVGAGGGGAGSPASDGTSGGAGGAGGVAYQTYVVTPGQSITYSSGAAGTGGSGASNGNPGGNTTATYAGLTITATGGAGGRYNSATLASGGTGSGGDGSASGGSGTGASGDTGGGGGGGIGGASGVNAGASGGTGGQSADVSGLFSVLSTLGISTTAPGVGGTSGSSNPGAMNGTAATGFGDGGGGAGWYGGNGGAGLYGGGGGGAAGYNITQVGGQGGAGAVVINPVVCSSAASCTLPWGGTLASGSSVTAYQNAQAVGPATCASTSESRTCTNGTLSGSYTSQSCTDIPQPTASLTATPSTIALGQSSTLTWNSTNATSCVSAGGFSTGNATSGSVSVSPSTTSTYSVTCSSASGGNSNPATATVSVLTPSLTITSAPDRLVSGQSTTLTWNGTNVNSCTITKNGTVWRSGAANGSHVYSGTASDPVTVQTKYTLTCTDINGIAWSTTASTLVNVGTGYQEF